jgi:hypothetical protein
MTLGTFVDVGFYSPEMRMVFILQSEYMKGRDMYISLYGKFRGGGQKCLLSWTIS